MISWVQVTDIFQPRMSVRTENLREQIASREVVSDVELTVSNNTLYESRQNKGNAI